MIEKLWYTPRWYHYLLWPLLWPFSCLFKKISETRRAGYSSGKNATFRAPVPIVVVGNITAGGNGKTPVVIGMVEWLQTQGWKPGVVSRGYGAKAPYYPYPVTSDATPAEVGDEPLLIHQRTGVPVVVAPKRSEAVQALLDSDIDVIITDDGLQHYALERDIECVVIDGQRRFGNAQYLPLGPLREGLSRLNEVDILICNGGEPRAGEWAMTLKPSHFVNLKTGERVTAEHFTGVCDAVAMAGIGHPPRFFNTLTTMGISLGKTVSFADHQSYQFSQIASLVTPEQTLLMTEKDAVKCRQFSQSNWWYLPVDAEIDIEMYEILLSRLSQYKEHYGSQTT
ncbi:tetraacyldisaccharide 4'-kinase [Thaumasiovibrio sp. DFM-14]|uniref:tetraacyldisaccharide 4'-kinase n=1 Tax=Thaumasiovibrio sp. DFM-14 TaxID=3384792 RepID=UPI0039A23CDF